MTMMIMMIMKESVSPALPLSAIPSSKEHTAWKRYNSSSRGFLLMVSGEKTCSGRFHYVKLLSGREEGVQWLTEYASQSLLLSSVSWLRENINDNSCENRSGNDHYKDIQQVRTKKVKQANWITIKRVSATHHINSRGSDCADHTADTSLSNFEYSVHSEQFPLAVLLLTKKSGINTPRLFYTLWCAWLRHE